jgi:hypothetical protein
MSEQRDFFTRLADRGEEVLARFAETPGGARVAEMVNGLRERLDDLQKRVMGLEGLERRLDAVEERLNRIDPEGAPAPDDEGEAVPGTATPPAAADTGTPPPSPPPPVVESPDAA